MLIGNYRYGRPYLRCGIRIPRLHIKGDVDFLVDTGSDVTFLMPKDVLKFGIDYESFSNSDETESTGAGGSFSNYVENATLIFLDSENKLYDYNIEIQIPKYDVGNRSLPSLLGRNIIDRWDMYYKPTSKILTFDVLSWDRVILIK